MEMEVISPKSLRRVVLPRSTPVRLCGGRGSEEWYRGGAPLISIGEASSPIAQRDYQQGVV
jgi:hypothetical protein